MTAARVAVIGPGRAGTAVALGLVRARRRVVAVAGGSPDSLAAFRDRVAGVRVADSPAEAAAAADLVVIATPDVAIADVATELAVATLDERHRVVHLAGSLGLAPLHRAALAGAGVAAVHPAMTIPTGADADTLVGAAWAVTASSADREWARDLVIDLGGDPFDVADADRVLYHAALTVGSNAVAAATSVARQLLLGARVDRPEQFLRALAHRSVDNVLADGAAAITGPVVRGDVATIAAHLDVLDRDVPSLATAYRHLGQAILSQVGPVLDAATRTELDERFERARGRS